MISSSSSSSRGRGREDKRKEEINQLIHRDTSGRGTLFIQDGGSLFLGGEGRRI
jgi:hypothetical protein